MTNRLAFFEEDGRRLVRREFARWPYAADGRPQATVEAELHERLLAAGVPVPRVVRVEPRALVLEHVAGEPLSDASPAAAWLGAGAALARVHALPETACDPGWAARDLADSGRRLGVDVDPLLAALPRDRPCRLLHGDPNPSNALAADGRFLAWLDWEAAGPGDPAWDLARLLLGLRAEGRTVPDAFWEGYGSRLQPELLAAYEPVFWLRVAGRRVDPRIGFLARAANAYVRGLGLARTRP